MNLRKIALVFAAPLALMSILAVSCGKDNGTGPMKSVPIVTTTAISTITRSTAESGGTVTSDNGYAVTARGICWSTSANPKLTNNSTSDGSDVGSFASSLTGLAYNTAYYVRAYAVNSEGTGYGNTVSFMTLDSAYTVTDIDGNVYQALSIGTQIWMIENLKVKHYRNGDFIPRVSDDSWGLAMSGAYCYYNNDNLYISLFGRYGFLYNWRAVNDSRGLAPDGWHVPSTAEWQTLVDFLGGATVAGGKMKETGTVRWNAPNTGATNESGFTAQPGGIRLETGLFQLLGQAAAFWHSNENDLSSAWGCLLSYDQASYRFANDLKTRGFSVRCVKD